MPHLLIAGATGSGKSVMVNALITSMLCNATPDEVRMILMDLKRVELAAYNGLPHLLVPVITEPEKAKAALKWAVGEMEARYRRLAGATARNIKGFNETRADPADRMPYIVIVIDELADLMMREGKNVEDPIVRLAQKARAVGIHMVLATQRPSVNVVTGLIKANFPSRIAFAMASQIDSRTILDTPGAEDLIGRGDMLYQPSDLPRPMRLQGVFVSDPEIAKVVQHWKDQIDDPHYDMSIIETGDESTGKASDIERRGGGSAPAGCRRGDQGVRSGLRFAAPTASEGGLCAGGADDRPARSARLHRRVRRFERPGGAPTRRGGAGRDRGRARRGRRMTTRDQSSERSGVDRGVTSRTVAPDYGPSLPERLFAARERKGVDLYRAERDTKIRARYLAALERGDYKELPGAVYTKGFLRNYALYLGLDADDVLLQWRRERGIVREAEPVIVVPKAIVAPRKGLTFSPAVVVAALLTVAVVAFGAYLVMQILRYAEPPTIALTQPRQAVIDVDEDTSSYVLRGTSIAGATVAIVSPSWEQPLHVSADTNGKWTAEVDLRRGRNQFDISATDPETQKKSDETKRIFITVPFRAIETPTLAVDQPGDGATFQNGAIPIQGTTTNATSVVVTATYQGPAAGNANPTTPKNPAPVTVNVGEDGAFNTPYELTTGRWSLTVTASNAEGKTQSHTRVVTVAYKGVNLVVEIKGGRAWIKVWIDGKVDKEIGSAGKVIANGRTLTFTGRDSVEVRTGSSGVTRFTLNGTKLGALGRSGTPETWLFEPPTDPQKTARR